MKKYSKEEKLAAVLAVEAGEGVKSVSRRLQINREVLRHDVGMYREHGEEGLSGKWKNWTGGEKLAILGYMHQNHLSCKQTSIKFGIRGSQTVWKWEQQYLKKGTSGLEPKKKGRPPKSQRPKQPLTQEEQLLAEIEYLRAENEYLKKLNALVAEREAREKRDKTTEQLLSPN
jgi:transposase